MITTTPFWRWEKMPVVNELTVKTSTVFDRDRDRDIVILKPNEEIEPYLEGEIQTDQLNLVLDHANIARSGMLLFRIYGFDDGSLVSDTLKQALQAMNLSGVRFLPV